ncbi:hypothetical protein [Paenibacillus aceti]|uniref:Uncharacterized protein n=1 Tax=Paenibacillus aceti TaxID=1820010 RepID=A0ABQ1W6F4_9BACL|nr:hypothetical protein [Paenibacillus aceti]GGG15768.1 hypothetical protein GCM10010913_42180 [Paenibacillus aceti]
MLTEQFTPSNIDFTNKETIITSVEARVAGWNKYLKQVRQTDVDPLLQQMKKSKQAYFAALNGLKEKAHEIATESVKLQDHIIEKYASGAPVGSLDISYSANRSAYISQNEVTSQKVIY